MSLESHPSISGFIDEFRRGYRWRSLPFVQDCYDFFNGEVVVEVAPGLEVTAVITKNSPESLDLAVEKEVHAVGKSSDVMIAVD